MTYHPNTGSFILTDEEAEKFDEDRAELAGFVHTIGKPTSDGQQHNWRREGQELLSYWSFSGTANRGTMTTNEPKIYGNLFLSSIANQKFDYNKEEE